MKVLVTGGAGYIGSILVRELLDKGYSVIVLDRLFFGRGPLEGIEDRIKILEDDIRYFDPSILNGVDTVIDLAALPNDPVGELNPKKTMEINCEGRVRVASLSKKKKVKRYILASTCSVYGFRQGILTEESETSPLTSYAKCNLLAEKTILPFAAKDFVVTVFRKATVYGFSYKMRFDLAVNGMVRSLFKEGKIPIMRDGTQWRPFIHVKDVAKAYIAAIEAESELVNHEVFNIGSDEQNIQVYSLAKMVADACNHEFKYEWYGSPDKRSYMVGFRKARETLNFKPEYTVRDGAREIWQALSNGLLDPDDPRAITVKWYKILVETRKIDL